MEWEANKSHFFCRSCGHLRKVAAHAIKYCHDALARLSDGQIRDCGGVARDCRAARVEGWGIFQGARFQDRSEEHTSELQSLTNLVCRLLLEKKKTTTQ